MNVHAYSMLFISQVAENVHNNMIFIKRTKHTSFKDVKLMDYKFESIPLNDCISTIKKE